MPKLFRAEFGMPRSANRRRHRVRALLTVGAHRWDAGAYLGQYSRSGGAAASGATGTEIGAAKANHLER
jgi:hypothetical protein